MSTSINFLKDKVIGVCSFRTRSAFESNEDIGSVEDRRTVVREIIDKAIKHLHSFFGSDNPSTIIFCVITYVYS